MYTLLQRQQRSTYTTHTESVPDAVVTRLIDMAVAVSGDEISPVMHRPTLRDCVTHEMGSYRLWYNTPDRSTHLVKLSDVAADEVAESSYMARLANSIDLFNFGADLLAHMAACNSGPMARSTSVSEQTRPCVQVGL